MSKGLFCVIVALAFYALSATSYGVWTSARLDTVKARYEQAESELKAERDARERTDQALSDRDEEARRSSEKSGRIKSVVNESRNTAEDKPISDYMKRYLSEIQK